jgi:hypothetical protein
VSCRTKSARAISEVVSVECHDDVGDVASLRAPGFGTDTTGRPTVLPRRNLASPTNNNPRIADDLAPCRRPSGGYQPAAPPPDGAGKAKKRVSTSRASSGASSAGRW